ncbi:MAG: malonyl-ACP O-methyltransferase BioC [Sedimentisphaerales bacterium]|nr:malonyl-ACP O-methyltransferase BioC [Sedimentisphaerales bacterium]MBN2841511.1 malonyl-ACP O-methyltransferase BioC [Sedimentisphaerales bacterium]
MSALHQPDKSLVRKRFGRSLTTYCDHAAVQAQTATRLADELIAVAGSRFDRIFEVGCGTGLLSRVLCERLDYGSYYLNDIVEECRAVTSQVPGSVFMPGDIEFISDLPTELDLIVANAVFQWLHDLPGLFKRLAGQLAEGGILAFSTFGPDNLTEIRQLTGISLDYYSLAEIMDILAGQYEVLCCYERSVMLEFADPSSVLRHLKMTGVTAIKPPRWTKADLNDFSDKYLKSFASNNGVILTWQPIIVIAGKK